MARKTTTEVVLDEYGSEWKVSGGDPAAPLVGKLRKYRVDRIVLPMYTLYSGELARPTQRPESVVDDVRLEDCLEVLS